MSLFSIRELAWAGVIAAVYAILTLAFAPISFAVYQVRVAEALAVLPLVSRAAIPGLYLGCMIANAYGMGWHDVVFGSLITLAAAIATHLIGRISERSVRPWLVMFLAPLPPVLFNAFGVSLYLAPILDVDYWFAVQMVGIGQIVACYGLGLPLLFAVKARKLLSPSTV